MQKKDTKSKHTWRCTMSSRMVWHPWPNTSAPGAPTRHTPKSIFCETKEICNVTNIFVQGAKKYFLQCNLAWFILAFKSSFSVASFRHTFCLTWSFAAASLCKNCLVEWSFGKFLKWKLKQAKCAKAKKQIFPLWILFVRSTLEWQILQ